MHGFDRTGPMGRGSRTGWGMGKCNPVNRDKNNDDNMNEEILSEKKLGRGLARRIRNRNNQNPI